MYTNPKDLMLSVLLTYNRHQDLSLTFSKVLLFPKSKQRRDVNPAFWCESPGIPTPTIYPNHLQASPVQ